LVEESEENQPSQQSASEAEKKPVAPTPAPARATTVTQAAVAPPKPPVILPKPMTSAPTPASRPQQPKSSGRRIFLKIALLVGAVLSFTPYVPWGSFLTSTVSTGTGKRYLLQKVRVDQNSKYGPASGQLVNVNDLSTFPANDHWVITYPTSGDPTIDSQNPDTFLKYELIRLPESLGGTSKKATDFVAFSKVCVHLWCSPNYQPAQGHQQYECPCHGSIYEVPDGKAVMGPASLQPAPANAIPMLTLQADAAGQLYVFYPNRDPTKAYPNDGVGSIGANGELGYGRDFASYNNFIKPMGELAADPKNAKQEVTS
jgi:Rieske Fe-S protein